MSHCYQLCGLRRQFKYLNFDGVAIIHEIITISWVEKYFLFLLDTLVPYVSAWKSCESAASAKRILQDKLGEMWNVLDNSYRA